MPEQRGRAVAIYTLAPLLGPSLGIVLLALKKEIANYLIQDLLLVGLSLKKPHGDGYSGLPVSYVVPSKYLAFSHYKKVCTYSYSRHTSYAS